MLLEKHQEVICGSCAAVVGEEALVPLHEIEGLAVRLTPGEEIPSGQCPCGEFAYIQTRVVELDRKAMACSECGSKAFTREGIDEYSGEVDEDGCLMFSEDDVISNGPIVCSGCHVHIDEDSFPQGLQY